MGVCVLIVLSVWVVTFIGTLIAGWFATDWYHHKYVLTEVERKDMKWRKERGYK